MGRVFVTSDIHGCLDEFKEGLKIIDFKKTDSLYVIGDILDKGPKSFETLNFVMNEKNIFLLKGNHEYMFQLLIEKDERIKTYIEKEGEEKLKSLRKYGENYLEKVYTYIKNLPYYCVIRGEFLLMHGGFDVDIESTKEEILSVLRKKEMEEEILLNRSLWQKTFDKELHEKEFGSKAFNIIIGHTPMQNAFNEINKVGIRKNRYGKKVICLDTGVFSSYDELQGKLSILELKEKDIGEIFYIKSKN